MIITFYEDLTPAIMSSTQRSCTLVSRVLPSVIIFMLIYVNQSSWT